MVSSISLGELGRCGILSRLHRANILGKRFSGLTLGHSPVFPQIAVSNEGHLRSHSMKNYFTGEEVGVGVEIDVRIMHASSAGN